MAGTDAIRDGNRITVALGVSNADSTATLPFKIDSVTGRLLVSTSGSSAISIIAITGTIDDSNVTFTAASQPAVLVINGGVYQTTSGAITWTYVAGTITLSSPVGTSGAIFGIA